MKFVSLPSIRSTVSQLIANASLAFALATLTGVTSSQAWAEANLTLDQMYEKESDLLNDVKGMSSLLWWWESRTDPSKPAYGTKTYLEFEQNTLNTGLSAKFYSSKEKQEKIKEAAYIEEKYGRLSNNDLEIKHHMLAERACGNMLSIAERGGKKALADVFLWGGSRSSICTRREERKIYLWTNGSFWEEFDLRMKAIAIQITEGKLQVESHVLAGAHFYLADLYSNKSSVIVRRGIDKTKYHLEQAKEAYGEACDTGVVDGCRMYNRINEHYYRDYLARFDEKAEKK